MKKLIVSLFLAMWAAMGVQASGDPEAGEALTVTCAACHGADGNSAAANFPKLAGQGEAYLLKQLIDIKEGNRVIVEMTGLLNPYDETQLEDMAAFYAAQNVQVGEANPELVALGESLYKAGNAETGVPACIGCHGPNGSGNDPAVFPALGGQHADYTASQLKKFQLGYRAEAVSAEVRMNDGDAMMMRTIAFRLKDFEIEALASYIQGLH